MVKKPKIFFFFEKIDIFCRNPFFFSLKLPKNIWFWIKQTQRSVCRRVWGSGWSLKKVMVEKPKIFIFFWKNWFFWPKCPFFSLKLPQNIWFWVKQTKISVFRRVWGSRLSLKKVMVEKPKIFIFLEKVFSPQLFSVTSYRFETHLKRFFDPNLP